MRKLIVLVTAIGALAIAPTAQATIHPIMLGWWCGDASGDPPGQTPGMNHSDQSTVRALQSTGFITESGLDPTIPASKFSSFDPVTDTGTPSNPGALNCPGAPTP